jgi:membrane peptidoglycan carboxypeptidase
MRFARKIREYGFGAKTNVDLPGENQGIFRATNKWTLDSLESISFGQEISVNALQMLRFVSAIANGGYLVEPKVLLKRDGGSDTVEPGGKRVLSVRVSKAMTEVMKQVVTKGTGKRASFAGYSAAGKTGTAQKAGKEGKYLEGKYIASFVGFVPADNPAISMILVFDEPVGLEDGGDVAAPAFSRIAKNIMRYLHIQEDDNYRYFNMPEDKNDRRDLRFLLADFRPASMPILRGAFGGGNRQSVNANGTISTGSFKMPDLIGHSYRDVFEILSSMGIKPMLSGSGIAVSQHPATGVIINRDSFCLVRFSRSRRG